MLFLLSVAVLLLGTLAIHHAYTDMLRKVCNVTTSPGICLKALRPALGSRTASPRRLGELPFRHLAEEGPALQAEARRETAAARDQSMRYCLREFDGNMRIYVHWLRGVVALGRGGGGDAARFIEARWRLELLLEALSTSGISCHGDQVDKAPVIRRVLRYKAMMQVTLDLMNATARSDPALADSLSDNGAGMPA